MAPTDYESHNSHTIVFHLNRMRRHKDVKKTHFIGKLTGSQTMLLNKG